MSKKLESLKIGKYRGIEELEIINLKQVNILVGDNNAGKTSLLEAIQIFFDPTMYTLSRVSRQRDNYKPEIRLNILDSLYYLFNIKKSDTHSFNISGIVEDTQRNVCVKVVKEKIYHLDKSRDILNNQEEIDNYVYEINVDKKVEKFVLNKFSDFLLK